MRKTGRAQSIRMTRSKTLLQRDFSGYGSAPFTCRPPLFAPVSYLVASQGSVAFNYSLADGCVSLIDSQERYVSPKSFQTTGPLGRNSANCRQPRRLRMYDFSHPQRQPGKNRSRGAPCISNSMQYSPSLVFYSAIALEAGEKVRAQFWALRTA